MSRCKARFLCFFLAGATVTASLTASATAAPVTLKVAIESLTPENGTFLTPVWVGFHDGTFDLYDIGSPAATFLERLAEDGNNGPLSTAFAASGAGVVDGTIPGPGGAIGPGEKATMLFTVDDSQASSRYFSYAAMVVPSNDAFISNDNPLAVEIFDADGNFLGADFIVLGSAVRDAGTEVNDEIPMNTALFGQTTPNTGVDENGVVHVHPGFLPPGSGGILDSAMFANADFTASGYQVARVTVRVIPAPSALALLAGGIVTLTLGRRLRRKSVTLET